MSLFKDTFHKGYINIFPNNTPNISNNGNIYMKSDNLLYYLNPDGIEYLLSVKSASTTDFLLAQLQNPLTLECTTYIPWDTGIIELDAVSINADATIINIGTAGTYNIKYTIYIENTDNTAIGINPTITSYIVINGRDSNAFRRYGNNTQSIITNNGNYIYSQSIQSIIDCTTNSSIKVKVSQDTGSNTSVLSSTLRPKVSILNIQRIFKQVIVGDYLSARIIGQQILLSGYPYDIIWNNSIKQAGNISVNSGDKSIINISSSGYYNITYDTTLTGDNQDIISTPEIESYIIINENDGSGFHRFGVNREIIITHNGNMTYLMTITSIIKLADGDTLKFRVKQSSGSNTIRFSGENDNSTNGVYKISNLNMYKMDSSNALILRRNTEITLSDNTLTPIIWNSQVDQNGDITWGNPQSRINIATTGTYDIVYTVELNNTDNSITGENPIIESFISIDGLTDNDRYGNYYKTIISNNGNMGSSYSKSAQIEIIGGSYIELFILQSTGSSNIKASSTNANQMMSISVIKTK